MKIAREKSTRLSAIDAFHYALRGARAVLFGASLALLCVFIPLVTGPAWSAERSPSPSDLPDPLAGRPTVTPAAQPQATPGATAPGSVSAVEAPLKPPAAPNDWPVLLRDGFDDNHYRWDTGTANFDIASLYRAVADGAYRWDLEARKPVFAWGESGVDVPAEFYAAVDVRLANGSAADVSLGLAICPGDLADTRLFLLSMADGVTVRRGIDDSAEILIPWTTTSAIQPDVPNRLAVKMAGSNLTLYVNDQPVAETTGAAGPPGRLCVAVWTDSPGNCAAQFDDFEVRVASGIVAVPPTLSPKAEAMPTPLPWGSVLPDVPHTSPPNWPIVFWDTFVDDGNGWVTYEQFDRQIEASKIVEGTFAWQFKAIEAAQPVVDAPYSGVSDFYAAVDVKRYSGPEDVWAGLAFRRVDERHFYAFLVNDERRYQIWVRTGDVLYQLVDPTPSEAIVAGGPNRVAAVGEGAVFTFFVNDRAITALRIESGEIQLAEGGLGLALSANAGDAGIIEFDNFEVRVPPKE